MREISLGAHVLFDKMTGVLVKQRRAYHYWYESDLGQDGKGSIDPSGNFRYDAYFEAIFHFLLSCSDETGNALPLAIELQWKSYLDAHLTRDAITRKRGRPFLDHAIHPSPGASNQRYAPLIAELIALGACPAETWAESPPFWISILVALQGEPKGSAVPLAAIKAGFKGRTRLRTTADDLRMVAYERYLAGDGDQCFRGLMDRLERIRDMDDDDDTTYSFFDLLSSLVVEDGSTEKSSIFIPLFSDSQIEELERDLQV